MTAGITRPPLLPVRRALMLALGIVIGHRLLLAVAGQDAAQQSVLHYLYTVVLGLVVTVGMWYVAQHLPPDNDQKVRTAWRLLALGLTLSLLGAVFEGLVDRGPSLADGFYLTFYPVFGAGLLFLSGASLSRSDQIKIVLDTAIVMIATFMLFWITLIVPTLAAARSQEPLATAIAMAYPFGDWALLFAVLRLLFSRSGRVRPALLLCLALSGFEMIVADAAYLAQSLAGDYQPGNWADTIYISALGLLIVAMAVQLSPQSSSSALPSAARVPVPRQFSWSVYIPYLFVGVAYGLLIWTGNHLPLISFDLLAWMVGSIISLVLVRQVVALRENTRLSGQLQAELIERKAAEQAVRELNADLEHRVSERTVELTREIAERQQAEQVLQQYVERLTTLHEIDQAILAEQPIGVIARAVLSRIQRLVSNQQASVILFEPEADVAVVVAALVDGEITTPDLHFPLSDFEISAAPQPGRVHVVDDVTQLAAPSPMEQRLIAAGIRSYLEAPVSSKEQIIGALRLESPDCAAFGVEINAIATEVADQLAIAIQQIRLFEQVRRHTLELEQRVADRTRDLTIANERLAELDRLKSKFVADVSHELRTPIANLKLYAELLDRGKPEKQADYVNVVRQQTQRLSQLVEDILDLSRLERARVQLTFGSIDLNAIIDPIVASQLARTDGTGLRLIFTAAENLPAVRGDGRQLSQVITNLLTNALNYTAAGFVQVSTSLEDGQVCLGIADSGLGIGSDDLPHIFDRFYRGRLTRQRNIPGSGLGLAIVKEIVDLHGGHIDVTSRLGEGTSFRVCFPPVA
ncbi:MAG: GAF domain-containing sensor histidine kinase [Anaerolineae bacterium]